MKSLCGRFGKIIRRSVGGVGAVFAGRFHLQRALRYVLLNAANHRRFIEYVDEFSSGFQFRFWNELLGERFRGLIAEQFEHLRRTFEELSEPRSWLLRIGWLRARRG